MLELVPKLWDETIETHRRAVHDAILDAAGALVAERGLRAVTMSALAERAGVGRATLYKYFPDVESVLAAWHDAHVTAHASQLVQLKDGRGSATQRLAAVLAAYADVQRRQHEGELAAMLHARAHVDHARNRIEEVVVELIVEAADDGAVRTDVPARELARFCLHALAAAASLTSKASVRRLVDVTMDGLRPPG